MMSAYEKTENRLRELNSAGLILHEKRLAYLWDKAKLLAADLSFGAQFTENDAFRRRYGEVTAALQEEKQTAAAFSFGSSQLSALHRCICTLERAYLCRILAKLAGLEDCVSFRALALRLFRDNPEQGSDRVSYLRNVYADEAFHLFAGILRDPTVTYADSFSGVCEDVYYARTRFCILPMENSSDGILTGFRSLLAKFDLKIAAVCEVSAGDGSLTRFALLQKNIGLPERVCEAKPVYFRFTLFADSAEVLRDVMTAADALGLPLCKIDTVSASYTDCAFAYDITLECSPATLPGFYCFLSLEIPHFTPAGLYEQLESLR